VIAAISERKSPWCERSRALGTGRGFRRYPRNLGAGFWGRSTLPAQNRKNHGSSGTRLWIPVLVFDGGFGASVVDRCPERLLMVSKAARARRRKVNTRCPECGYEIRVRRRRSGVRGAIRGTTCMQSSVAKPPFLEVIPAREGIEYRRGVWGSTSRSTFDDPRKRPDATDRGLMTWLPLPRERQIEQAYAVRNGVMAALMQVRLIPDHHDEPGSRRSTRAMQRHGPISRRSMMLVGALGFGVEAIRRRTSGSRLGRTPRKLPPKPRPTAYDLALPYDASLGRQTSRWVAATGLAGRQIAPEIALIRR